MALDLNRTCHLLVYADDVDKVKTDLGNESLGSIKGGEFLD
jgi:hypothetical protein